MSGPWPGPAGAPRSDSLAPPYWSGTAACRNTAAQGSHGLRRGRKILLLSEEKFGANTNSSISIGQITHYNPQLYSDCPYGLFCAICYKQIKMHKVARDTHIYTHTQLFLLMGRVEHRNRINRQLFSKHNSLFNNYHTLSLGQRGMTDTKTDHNIILMSKTSTGWEKAREFRSVHVCEAVPVRVQHSLYVQASGGKLPTEFSVICLHESEWMTEHHCVCVWAWACLHVEEVQECW